MKPMTRRLHCFFRSCDSYSFWLLLTVFSPCSNVVSVSCLFFFVFYFFDSNDLSGILFPFFSPLDCTQETEPDWHLCGKRERNELDFFPSQKVVTFATLQFSSTQHFSPSSVLCNLFLSRRSWYWYFSCKRFTYSNFWLFTTLVRSILTWFATLLLFHSYCFA